jgi:phosphatidylserine/phosphatidylglycerophosphate/cardiolipin synthase-like enzyme
MGLHQQTICFHSEDWARALISDCASANHSIVICAMSMIPPRSNVSNVWSGLFGEWVRARKRGVHVSITLAAPQQLPTATRGNNDAGNAAVRSDISIKFATGARLLHAKAVVIDGTRVWLGSGNFTLAAMTSNCEMWVSFDSPAIADRILKTLGDIK